MSLTVKAVHLELASDLSSEAFIACLRCFVSRCGFLWSDHGSNFIGANWSFADFLETQQVQKSISEFYVCFTALSNTEPGVSLSIGSNGAVGLADQRLQAVQP